MSREVKENILKKLRNGEEVNGDIMLYFDLQPYLVSGEEVKYVVNLKWETGPNTWTYYLAQN